MSRTAPSTFTRQHHRQVRGLSVRWSLARADRSGCDVVELFMRAGQATLERRCGDVVTLERRESGFGPIEVERSSCGDFVAVSVRGLIDAVFSREGVCVYARCVWIADLSPLGGQCECRGGQVDWSNE